jgi:hypothetical protein
MFTHTKGSNYEVISILKAEEGKCIEKKKEKINKNKKMNENFLFIIPFII